MSENNTNKSFEKSLSELEELVSKLENGNLSLDESISLYKKGTDLLQYCNSVLDNAEQEVTVWRSGAEVSTDEFNSD